MARRFKKDAMSTEAYRVERIPLTGWRVGGPLDRRRRSVSRDGVVEVDRCCKFLQINEICYHSEDVQNMPSDQHVG